MAWLLEFSVSAFCWLLIIWWVLLGLRFLGMCFYHFEVLSMCFICYCLIFDSYGSLCGHGKMEISGLFEFTSGDFLCKFLPVFFYWFCLPNLYPYLIRRYWFFFWLIDQYFFSLSYSLDQWKTIHASESKYILWLLKRKLCVLHGLCSAF